MIHLPNNLSPVLKARALTLAELLVVVIISGLMATLLVPKLVQQTARAGNANLMRTSLLALNHLTEHEFLESATPNLFASAQDQLGILRACDNATGQGCWNTAAQGVLPGSVTNQAVVLKSGVVIAGLRSVAGGTTNVHFIIDANGAAGPNALGSDQMNVLTCPTQVACGDGTLAVYRNAGYAMKPGAIVPLSTSGGSMTGASFTFYDTLLNN